MRDTQQNTAKSLKSTECFIIGLEASIMHIFVAVVDEMMIAIGLTKLSDIKANLWYFVYI